MAEASKKVTFKIEFAFRVLYWVLWLMLLAYCVIKVSDCYIKYSLKRISTSSYVMNESPFEYPSFTVCINMDREITGAVGNMTWWSNEQYKKYTSFPFEPLRTVNDGFCWDKRYGKEPDLSCNLNSNATLEKYGLHISDIWDPQIRGLWGELSPCYTYHSKEKRDIGFPSRFSFRVKTRADVRIAVIMTVHGKGAYLGNLGNVFGNFHVLQFPKENTNLTSNTYEISRQRVTELNREQEPCVENQNDIPIGMVKSVQRENKPMTIEECYADHIERTLNCSLPFKHMKEENQPELEWPLCESNDQFNDFKSLTFKLHSMDIANLMKEMQCIPSCTYNKYIVREWYDSNFDMLAYQFGDDQRDGANFEQTFIFTAPDVEIIDKFLMVDGDGMFANIGGFMGLLLGTSCLSLIESILAYCAKFLSRKKL